MKDINNLHSKLFKLFKAGIVNFDDGALKDVAYIATEDLPEFSKKWKNQAIFKNGHFDDGSENHQEEVVGKISDTWVEGEWIVGSGVITDEGLSLLTNGQGVSVTFAVSQAIQNQIRDRKEGIEYNYRIVDMIPDHIAIVKNPRYEGAGLKHNSKDISQHLVICSQNIKNNHNKLKKDVDINANACNDIIEYERLTKISNMFSLKKKHNNAEEIKKESDFIKNNTSENILDENIEKKYAEFGHRKMMGMDEEEFKEKLMEAWNKKHNSDLSEDEEALEHLIKIEHEGNEIELTLKEAMELIQMSEKVEHELENHERKEIDEEKYNNQEMTVETKRTEQKEMVPEIKMKENMSKKHNSYMQSLRSTVHYSNADNVSPNIEFLREKSHNFTSGIKK